MLKKELIKIKLRKNHIDYYSKLGYEVNREIQVLSNHLHKGSGAIVSVICDNCNKEIKIEYKTYYRVSKKTNSILYYCCNCKYCRIKETNLKKYGVENIMLVNEISDKVSVSIKQNNNKISKKDRSEILKNRIIMKHGDLKNFYNLINEKKKNCLNKYGVENVMQIDEIKKKGQATCLEKYGQYNIMFIDGIAKKASEKANKTKIIKNLIISEDKLTEFEKYRRINRRLIYKYKKELFSNWDGYDYYDNEYIKENLNLNYLDRKYPSIDHKISIFQGFIENIDPYIIGNIENMCITKREINSSKFIRIKPSQKYLKKI